MPGSAPDPHAPGPPPVLLTLDHEGRWFHDDRPIEHPGLVSLLNRHLVVLDDDAVEVRVPGRDHVERALVTVAELPYYVISLKVGPTLQVRLNDETEETLAASDLWLVGDDRLYCRVKGGRFPARLLRQPYLTLAAYLEEADSGWVLPLAGRRETLRVEPLAPAWPPRHDP